MNGFLLGHGRKSAKKGKIYFSEMATRKLSKTMRKMNLAYKVIMAVLAGVSLMLATMTDTDMIYYQFVSMFSSAFSVVWSQVLDACKNYESEETPMPSPTTLAPASNTPKSETATPKVDEINYANDNTV